MLKILSVVDKEGTALDRLAKGVAKYHDKLDYVVVDVHPKRPSENQLELFRKHAKDADIIEWQYFRTAEMLRSTYPWLKQKKQILVHNNPYSITESDWNTYDMVVGSNVEIYEKLGEITNAPTTHIPLTVDTDFWTFNREWLPIKRVLMVANRIESKKGILEVAQACKELGLQFILVGAPSDVNYLHEVLKCGTEFYQAIDDQKLLKLYHSSSLLVCNSVDNFESGTLPILEAMLSGCPVLSRKVGHVPELYNGENMIINPGHPEDIKEGLDEAMHSDLEKIRQKAWDTAKTRSHERRAYMYQKLYRQVMWPNQKSVSVVMPVNGVTLETIEAVLNQTYQNLELIICDDNVEGEGPAIDIIPETKRIVRFINQPTDGYGLAKQRNLGVIEATGEIIVFCDQRMKMEPDAIEQFVKRLSPKRWLYGNKGAKKEFVENFSCVYRDEIIRIGLFNERIDRYGGMSQYIRSIAKKAGFKTEYVEEAKATSIGKSKRRFAQRNDIIKMKNRLWKMDLQL